MFVLSLSRQLIHTFTLSLFPYELWWWSEWGKRVLFSATIIYCLSVYSEHLSAFRSYSWCFGCHYSWSSFAIFSIGLNIRKLFHPHDERCATKWNSKMFTIFLVLLSRAVYVRVRVRVYVGWSFLCQTPRFMKFKIYRLKSINW